MKTLKENFPEIFTLLAWVTLLGFVLYCTITLNKTDSVRDAWNILILIAGFVWGSKHQKAQDQRTTTELTPDGSALLTTEPASTQSESK